MSDQGPPSPEDPYAPPPQQPGQQPPQWGQQPPQWGQQPPYGGPPSPYGYGPPAGPAPDNYLVWAILSTLLCCLPLGVVSIVYAAQVNGKWAIGDVAGAQAASDRARTFAIWSAVAGALLWILAGCATVATLTTGTTIEY